MKLYRAKSIVTTCGINVHFDEYEITKETPKGYWIVPAYEFIHLTQLNDLGFGGKRWMCKNAFRRFAYETKEEALQNLIHRQRKAETIYRRKAHDAVRTQTEAARMLGKLLLK